MKNRIETIADIASLAGVSKSTVSRALNDSPLISEATRERIKTIAREHSFTAHAGARNLSLKKTRTLSIIAPMSSESEDGVNDPYFIELLKGAIGTCRKLNYDLLISSPHPASAEELGRHFTSNRADGVMVIGCGRDELLAEIAGKGPFIVVGSTAPEKLCSVDCDNVEGGMLATNHLLEQGCMAIAFLGGPETDGSTRLRFQGYREALAAHGLDLRPERVLYGDYTGRSGSSCMRRWLATKTSIDGVFVCSDLMAMGAVQAIRECDLSVGRDIAVVGFDDIPMAEFCSPPLTTIRQNIIKIGETLVTHLCNHIDGGGITRTVMPVELVVRQSSVR